MGSVLHAAQRTSNYVRCRMQKFTRKVVSVFIASLFLFLLSEPSYASHGWLVYFEGSFSGRVVDAETKKPIEGAVALAEYYIHLCGIFFIPTCGTDYITFNETTTGADGRFLIYPRIIFYPWPFTLGGSESEIIIYKQGYKVYKARRNKLIAEDEIALEPVLSTYYPRKEELHKAQAVYGVDLRDTKLYNAVIQKEENDLKKMERYPNGVIFYGLVDEWKRLDNPQDIAVDKNFIYVGDRGLRTKLKLFTLNGDWVRDMDVCNSGSGYPITIETMLNGELWAATDGHLVKYQVNSGAYIGYEQSDCLGAKLKFSKYDTRFKVDNEGFFRYVNIKRNDYAYASTRNGFFVADKEGTIQNEYKPENELFRDVVTDAEDYSYVTFIDYEIGKRGGISQKGIGILKINKNAELEKKILLNVVNDVHARSVNIAIDNKDRLYLAYNSTINVYDKELNYIETIQIKTSAIGEVAISGIISDSDGEYLYMIEAKYNRIIKYDLKNKRLVEKGSKISFR